MRYGAKGSLSINLKTGLWHNFETGEKGNALQLISQQKGFSNFKDTINYARDYLNYSDTVTKVTQVKKEKNSIDDSSKEANNKKAYAEKLVEKSQPIEASLAEKYLKEHRGLSAYTKAELRYIPQINTWHENKKITVPALLAIARDEQGKVNHAQVIRLDPKAGDKDQKSTIIKQTYGSINGLGIELNKGAEGKTTYLAEGVETGLSILEVEKDAKVFALLSKNNFNKVNLSQLTEKVVLCLDNDGNKTFADEVILKAAARLISAGKKVELSIPNRSGYDFNDVLKNKGLTELKSQLSRKIDAQELISNPSKFNNLEERSVESLANSCKIKNPDSYYKEDGNLKLDLVKSKTTPQKELEL